MDVAVKEEKDVAVDLVTMAMAKVRVELSVEEREKDVVVRQIGNEVQLLLYEAITVKDKNLTKEVDKNEQNHEELKKETPVAEKMVEENEKENKRDEVAIEAGLEKAATVTNNKMVREDEQEKGKGSECF